MKLLDEVLDTSGMLCGDFGALIGPQYGGKGWVYLHLPSTVSIKFLLNLYTSCYIDLIEPATKRKAQKLKQNTVGFIHSHPITHSFIHFSSH